MYVLIREHLVPVHVTEKDILKVYQAAMDDKEITLTSTDLNRYIRQRYRREEVWHSITTTLEYDTEDFFLRAILAETMNDDFFKRGVGFLYKNKKNNIKGPCPICLNDETMLVVLDACNCSFCEKCIKESVKYSDRCPLCYSTIKGEDH